MPAYLLVVLCMLSGALQASSPSAASAKGDNDFIEVDGSKNPGQIPEWLTWEQGFIILNQWHGKDSGFNRELREALAPAEFAAVERAAAEQHDRRARLESEAQAMLTSMGSPDPATEAARVFNERAFVLELEYRRSILALRDRLLESLSPESQAVLQSWMSEMKEGIKARIAKADVARWRMPE